MESWGWKRAGRSSELWGLIKLDGFSLGKNLAPQGGDGQGEPDFVSCPEKPKYCNRRVINGGFGTQFLYEVRVLALILLTVNKSPVVVFPELSARPYLMTAGADQVKRDFSRTYLSPSSFYFLCQLWFPSSRSCGHKLWFIYGSELLFFYQKAAAFPKLFISWLCLLSLISRREGKVPNYKSWVLSFLPSLKALFTHGIRESQDGLG